jgi:hypothetical protein
VRKESMSEEMLSRVYGTGKLLFVKIRPDMSSIPAGSICAFCATLDE